MMMQGSERVFQVSTERELSDLHVLKSRAQKADEKRMREVAAEFESLFVQELFKSMRRTIPKSDYLNGGLRQDIFEDMLYQEYARKISHSGGLGLGDMVYRYLLSTQKEKPLE
ncbi:rod-binding protein [Thermospira aquatica]|uniref:Rod-binding protein n=1 Tax=Thermospira aquatica TaxID=2828656 RepID=A0AAX3BA86_9SPIR|nr:rod-binding protein [Thermospira aquatica]URA09156.1 rod-binding protein [Thermospira aquatica]